MIGMNVAQNTTIRMSNRQQQHVAPGVGASLASPPGRHGAICPLLAA